MGLSADDLRNLHGGAVRVATPPVVKAVVAPAPAPAPASKTRGVNKFPGDCLNCGGRVLAGIGLRDKVDGKWVVFHDGGCPAPVPDRVEVDFDAGTIKVTPVPEYPIYPGLYTVENDTGHRTFRVSVQPDDADFKPGEVIIAFLSGPNNTSDFTSFGFVKGTVDHPRVNIWQKHKGNTSLADDLALLLAEPARIPIPLEDGGFLAEKHCRRCDAALSTPESVRAGIGPWCIKREMGLV